MVWPNMVWKNAYLIFFVFLFGIGGDAFAQTGGEEEMSVEEFMQGLSSVRKVFNRRDPFEENQPSYVKEEKPAVLDEAKIETAADELHPLERYPVSNYTVKAVLLGDRYPRALLKLPNGGSAVVQEKMRLGDKNGIIEKIDRTGLKVIEKIKNNFGSFDTISSQLSVGGQQKNQAGVTK